MTSRENDSTTARVWVLAIEVADQARNGGGREETVLADEDMANSIGKCDLDNSLDSHIIIESPITTNDKLSILVLLFRQSVKNTLNK